MWFLLFCLFRFSFQKVKEMMIFLNGFGRFTLSSFLLFPSCFVLIWRMWKQIKTVSVLFLNERGNKKCLSVFQSFPFSWSSSIETMWSFFSSLAMSIAVFPSSHLIWAFYWLNRRKFIKDKKAKEAKEDLHQHHRTKVR